MSLRNGAVLPAPDIPAPTPKRNDREDEPCPDGECEHTYDDWPADSVTQRDREIDQCSRCLWTAVEREQLAAPTDQARQGIRDFAHQQICEMTDVDVAADRIAARVVATVGVHLSEDERGHLIRLCNELEALEESALRNGEGPDAKTRAAERAALRKLMYLPASAPVLSENARDDLEIAAEGLRGLGRLVGADVIDRLLVGSRSTLSIADLIRLAEMVEYVETCTGLNSSSDPQDHAGATIKPAAWVALLRRLMAGADPALVAEARERVKAEFEARRAVGKSPQSRCPGRDHRRHVLAVCEGSCCTSCGGPIDDNSECRCDSGGGS